MKITALIVSMLTAALLMSGCAPQTLPGGAYGGGTTTGGVGSGGNTTYGYGNAPLPGYVTGNNGNNAGGQYTPAQLNNPSSILAQRVIYFDFDRSDIRPEYMNILNAHSALLSAYPNLRVRLEGHADERGSREYNVALSERRGYSVLDYMQLKGVRSNQMDVIGYGEEIPAAFGHNEASWSKNRRVEIKYAGE